MNRYPPLIEFTLFYIGLYPICKREVAWLNKLNKNGRLGFQAINQDDVYNLFAKYRLRLARLLMVEEDCHCDEERSE